MQTIEIRRPRGELEIEYPDGCSVEINEGRIIITAPPVFNHALRSGQSLPCITDDNSELHANAASNTTWVGPQSPA